VANLGDSRAVIGCLGRSNKIVAEPLTRDHNASMEEVRQELISSHPDDSQIVVLKHGVWRIKGIIQVGEQVLLEHNIFFGVDAVGYLWFPFYW
jgi:pyruvate dehydrogenase phosphatase